MENLQQQQTRIPKFGVSRLPVPHLRSPSGGEPPIDELRIGRRVRVTDREGVLRYVGNVEFCNAGSTSSTATSGASYWCGIELDAPAGKNDGCVRGVRYFTCRPGHGLMVPSSKVTLLDAYEDDVDLDEGVDSGPYSLIFALGEAQNFLAQAEPKRRRVKEQQLQLQLQQHHHEGKRPNNLQLDEGGGGGSVFRKLIQKELEDAGSKRNSLDMDESSLGILTPNQIEAAYLDEKVLSMSQKPKDEDRSTAEFSFGLLDEQLLNNLTLTVSRSSELPVEQTPSPEELPFDPTPIAENQKEIEIAKNSKSAINTFVTSITSITSLDTGYQGDGEMSRPASRGAENPPLTRRPAPRAQIRKQTDPMTDSDFYTESEADLVEENPIRGDRRVQVIDGTLYGVDPQAAADIYANNRENMDSSGIFTDLENNPKTEEESSAAPPPPSPSEASTKTISENSQKNPALMVKTSSPTPSQKTVTNRAKYQAQVATPLKKGDELKSGSVMKKPANKWDAVMNKISKGERNAKPDYKNVKSKIFKDLQVNNPAQKRCATVSKPPSKKPTPTIQSAASTLTAMPKSSLMSTASAQSVASPAKKRRLRQPAATRQSSYVEGSVRSLTTSSTLGSRRASYKPPQLVLTADPPKNRNNVEEQQQQQQQFFKNDHKSTNTSPLETTETGTITDLSSADIERLEIRLLKEIDRNNVQEKNIKLLEQERNIQEESRSCMEEKGTDTEELNLTVNASSQTDSSPNNDPDRLRFELRCVRESLDKERRKQLAEKERSKLLENELGQYRNELKILNIAHGNLKRVNSELRDSIRLFVDNVHKKELEANSLRDELERREELESKEAEFKEQRERLGQRFAKLEAEKERGYSREYASLKEEFERLFREKESLKSIIDMKREENDELKRSLTIANEDVSKLKVYETKSNLLMTRVEQLEHQLEMKSEREQTLLSENKKLDEYLREESNQRRRALQFIEELQWKLKQSKEVTNNILGYSKELNLNLTQSHRFSPEQSDLFRERNAPDGPNSNFVLLTKLEKDSEQKGADSDISDLMGPTSLKVKSVVKKSESVSYALDLDDSPDVVAYRIVRRSIRLKTPPKNKSPREKRGGGQGNPLSQSASSSAILTTSDKTDSSTSNIENLYDEVKDLEEATLPKLPTDRDGVERLPTPEGIAEEKNKSELQENEEDMIDLDEDDNTSNTEDGA